MALGESLRNIHLSPAGGGGNAWGSAVRSETTAVDELRARERQEAVNKYGGKIGPVFDEVTHLEYGSSTYELRREGLAIAILLASMDGYPLHAEFARFDFARHESKMEARLAMAGGLKAALQHDEVALERGVSS